MDGDLKYWVWLNSLTNMSPGKRFRLLKHFGDPSHIWHASEEELAGARFLNSQSVEILKAIQPRKEAAKILQKASSAGMEIVTFYDERYPYYLKYISDPPSMLYAIGKLVPEEICLAVVGSRKATYYGLDIAEKISGQLARTGLTIVSGMARGIDSRAHRGALAAGGRTVAVLGCGLDIAYPYENLDLMKEICKNGAVISEYMPGIPPVPYNFPARNRIISGMSLGVAVIEANEKSGSLITAGFALDQGREVFALPGNINSRNSSGTNKLIRDGAKIVTEVEDILEELKIGGTPGNTYCTDRLPAEVLGGDEASVAKRLAEGPLHIDNIARECGMSIQLTSSILVMLELNGFVEQLPGKVYRLSSLY